MNAACTVQTRQEQLQRMIVTADQMRDIEAQVFAAGMPIPALMEKVGLLIARRIQVLYPLQNVQQIGILVGPGHNGGDALVVARELHLSGYEVAIHCPFSKQKQLTAAHASYARSLDIAFVERIESLQSCDLLIDGLFGFGLERPLEGAIAAAVDQLNQRSQPVVSIDLPSGIATDTGAVLGTAIRASRTFCLGLWKLGLLQDAALEHVGAVELIDFGLPLETAAAVIGAAPTWNRITPAIALAALPTVRSKTTHKYRQGHLLLISGSHRYMGAAILAALGARASGVGMLSLAVPKSLKPSFVSQLPDALLLGCPETETGAIAQLPDGCDLGAYDAIACGPGLTRDAGLLVQSLLPSDRPLILDADGLNILAEMDPIPTLEKRSAPTVLTPHPGEFKRLFPQLQSQSSNIGVTVQKAAQQSGAIVVLKGARAAIALPQGTVWINPESTPALARGGSGDVLTGLVGGLAAQAAAQQQSVGMVIPGAVWWHAQAGILAAQERTELGVDAVTLSQYLIPALQHQLQQPNAV